VPPAIEKENHMNATLLWLAAVVVAIIGLVQLLQGQIILGIVLFVVAALIGPGGYSVFRTRT
jgi:TM2 domain-containing membrane protein YozV